MKNLLLHKNLLIYANICVKEESSAFLKKYAGRNALICDVCNKQIDTDNPYNVDSINRLFTRFTVDKVDLKQGDKHIFRHQKYSYRSLNDTYWF